MLCAVFAIPQCGFISFALGKVVIFHWVCGSGSAHARIWSGGGVGLLKYGISIYCNFILIRPCLWPGKAHLELSEVGVILHIPPAQGH